MIHYSTRVDEANVSQPVVLLFDLSSVSCDGRATLFRFRYHRYALCSDPVVEVIGISGQALYLGT